MGIRLDRPFYTVTTHDQNLQAQDLWEGESLGGIKENNRPVPAPIAVLLAIIITTAFMLTLPLWGQRPTAAIFAGYVDLMHSQEVQKIESNKDLTPRQADEQALALIEHRLEQFPSPYAFQRKQHIINMDQLRFIAPQIEKLRQEGADLEEYSIIGPDVVKQNFEGNQRPDGTTIRKQPHWDIGMTIDVWYVAYFCIAVFFMVKGLPPISWQPDHTKAH
jgi:hypothetical protein